MFNELNMSSLNAHHYSELLDNQNIVMVGDSLMRYQYLSLVYLTHTYALYPENLWPSILWEKGFDSWVQFFNASNMLLFPNEYCDCFRTTLLEACENRYYYHNKRNISISYIAYMGDEIGPKVHGHWSPNSNETNHKYFAPSHAFIPYNWEADSIQEALFDHVAKMRPTPSVLIINAGAWPNFYRDEGHRNSVLNLATSLFDRVIWKTTSYDQNNVGMSSYGICKHAGIECLSLEWTKYLKATDYTDRLHFQAYVYNDITIQLILQLTSHQSFTKEYVPMSAASHGAVVRYKTKRYLVDELGLLRPFSLPVKSAANGVCFEELSNRTHLTLFPSTLKRHILGAPLSDICAIKSNIESSRR